MQNSNSASNDREFLGITQNEMTLQGVVQGDPVIYNDNFAYLSLRTTISEQGPNGQWVDTPVDVPVIATDTGKVNSISQYVKDGRRLLIYAYYKPWMNEGQAQHAFVIKKMVFGPKKWEGNSQSTPSMPGLPTS